MATLELGTTPRSGTVTLTERYQWKQLTCHNQVHTRNQHTKGAWGGGGGGGKKGSKNLQRFPSRSCANDLERSADCTVCNAVKCTCPANTLWATLQAIKGQTAFISLNLTLPINTVS